MRWTPLVAAVAALVACSTAYEPTSAQEMIDRLEADDLVDCTESRSPVPDVITCVDPAGDLTFGLTDDGPARAATISGDGPHLIGPTWVVLSFDGDDDRIREIRDTLGGGVVYVRDDDGTLVPE